MLQSVHWYRYQPNFNTEFPKFDVRDKFDSPYFLWYLYKSNEALDGMKPHNQKYMKLLTDEIENSCGTLYEKVDSQLQRRVISLETIQFLFKPGEVLLSKQHETAYIALDWLRIYFVWSLKDVTFSIAVSHYQFDGRFYRSERAQNDGLKLELRSPAKEEIHLESLDLLPPKYAQQSSVEKLVERGKKCWSYRNGVMVSYEYVVPGNANNKQNYLGRFLVGAYANRQSQLDNQIHYRKSTSESPTHHTEMDGEKMDNDQPPA